MKIDITCIDALCLVQLIECLHSYEEPEFVALRFRIMSALKEAGFRPLNDDDVLLPVMVKDTI